MAHDARRDPTGDEEIENEAEDTAESTADDLTPLEQAELRQRLALETQSYLNGMEG